jgi:CRISPR-associated protein Cmr1
MITFNLKCKIITPLFVGGANQQPELRTQSINGILRWWFRIAGGSFEDERRIFGWGGDKANQGLVRLFIKDFNKLQRQQFQKEFDNRGFVLQNRGINYLGFSLDQRFRRDQNKPQREYIIENQTFDLTIRFHPRSTDEDIKKFFCALWLAFNLGNFGSRSRRGFGSIMIERIDGEFPQNFNLKFKSEDNNIEKWLKEQLNYIKNLGFWGGRQDIPFVFSENFKIYKIEKGNFKNWERWKNEVQKGRNGRYLKNSWGLNQITNWKELLDFMGFLLMAFRSYRPPDYQNAKIILQGNRTHTDFERPIFGLPLSFYYSSLGKRDMVHLKRENETLRRASPLMFKVLEVNNNYEGFFIVAKSKFIPDKSKLVFHGVDVGFPTNKSEWEALDKFIETLKNYNIIKEL